MPQCQLMTQKMSSLKGKGRLPAQEEVGENPEVARQKLYQRPLEEAEPTKGKLSPRLKKLLCQCKETKGPRKDPSPISLKKYQPGESSTTAFLSPMKLPSRLNSKDGAWKRLREMLASAKSPSMITSFNLDLVKSLGSILRQIRIAKLAYSECL